MRKIMRSLNSQGTIIKYIPARLTEGKEWYVSFYAQDPTTKQLRRKRVKINRVRGAKEKRKFARELISDLNDKLSRGWNPFTEQLAPKGFTTFSESTTRFLRRKQAELRKDSLRTYVNHVKRFRTWLDDYDYGDIATAYFTKSMASDFADDYLFTGVTNTSYNNLLTVANVLFNWLVAKEYIAENPFKDIQKLKKSEKFRKIIPPHWLAKVKADLATHLPNFILPCMLQFYAEIRPSEQCRLKVSDVDLDKRIIIVPSSASKSGLRRVCTISDYLYPHLEKILWERVCKDFYLIGNDFLPSKSPISRSDKYNKAWGRMRKRIKMPKEYQFYSLRDSGVKHMFDNHIPVNDIMNQMGHTDLKTTTIYISNISSRANKQLKDIDEGL